MNLQLTDYLLALAALSLSFVAFSTIVVALRQALGSRLTPFDILLVRFFIETGFIVTLFALLPVMLNATGLDTPLNWRLSSASGAVLIFAYGRIYMQRRRRTPGVGPRPFYLKVNTTLTVVAIIGLVLNAVGWPFHPGAALYTVAFTWMLVQSGLGFLQTLHLFLEPSPPDEPPTVPMPQQLDKITRDRYGAGSPSRGQTSTRAAPAATGGEDLALVGAGGPTRPIPVAASWCR